MTYHIKKIKFYALVYWCRFKALLLLGVAYAYRNADPQRSMMARNLAGKIIHFEYLAEKYYVNKILAFVLNSLIDIYPELDSRIHNLIKGMYTDEAMFNELYHHLQEPSGIFHILTILNEEGLITPKMGMVILNRDSTFWRRVNRFIVANYRERPLPLYFLSAI